MLKTVLGRPSVVLSVAALVLLSAPVSRAEEDVEHTEEHGERHKASHGGYFADAADIYHYELLLSRDGAWKLYLYDHNAQPMSAGPVNVRWTLCPDGEYPLRGDWTPSTDGTHYTAQFPPVVSDTIHIVIAARKGDEWHPVEFVLPLDGKVQA
ncbi:MAG: hypothetical protein MOGMAGMI_00123 [Candidatus Omnitrophica bacterium]|nr:hypothetical protein [Candidatus Omnitrophota bacterium]